MACSDSNPKMFWNTLKKLQCSPSNSSSDAISASEWHRHFKKLNETSHTVSDSRYDDVLYDLGVCEKSSTFCELDFKFSQSELADALKGLKNNKASGLDRISNEMLKHSNDRLSEAILKLFNFVFSSSTFPSLWSKGIISTIFKSGDRMSCDNYRGINISSCLSKLFTTMRKSNWLYA
jgi:hypothetical protein